MNVASLMGTVLSFLIFGGFHRHGKEVIGTDSSSGQSSELVGASERWGAVRDTKACNNTDTSATG